MATRFYLAQGSGFAAPVNPAFAAWGQTTGAIRRRMLTATTADALTNLAITHATIGASTLYGQWVSDRLAADQVFTSGTTTFGCQVQGLESAINDNIINRVRAVKIVSDDGATIRATLIALGNAASVVEWNTALRNLTFLGATAAGASYTTIEGDRLVVELGAKDSAGASIQGTLRFGADSSGTGDLGANETDTTTTLRPWFETSANLVFATEVLVKRISTRRPIPVQRASIW